MAWSVSRNNLCSTVGEVLYLLKEQLVIAGWTVWGSGDGIGAYGWNPGTLPADVITSGGAVDGGFGNSKAWCRLQDPAGVREVVFRRGSTGDRYIQAWYSAADKFVDSVGDTDDPPTATDQVSWYELSAAVGGILFLNVIPVRVNIFAQSTAEDGVYAFYCLTHVAGTGGINGWIIFEATDSTVGDNGTDGALMQCNSYQYAPSVANLTQATSGMTYGHLLGTFDGEFYEFASLLPNDNNIDLLSQSHPDALGQLPLLTINYMRFAAQSGSKVGWKGQSKWLRWNANNNTIIPDALKQGSNYYMVYFGLAIPGWPDSTPPML
jgi:hypothetical protein